MRNENLIDRIENKTLAKLTTAEVGALGLLNEGFCTYRGELKTRYNGMTRKTDDGVTFWFENKSGTQRVEFTELVNDTDDEARHWVARLLDIPTGLYETYCLGISGCGFFR